MPDSFSTQTLQKSLQTAEISGGDDSKRHGPLVQFARFNDGRLDLFKAHTGELKYYVISHVWGKTIWMRVSCLDGEILVSEEKAKFIEEQLPSLVGNMPFWMDTLTVNQKNKAEVIATVQSIPDIFRDAEETIAIREHDGIYKCCEEAIKDFSDLDHFRTALLDHAQNAHQNHVYEESYLHRLWTLQESLLSHTIRVVVNSQDRIKDCAIPLMEKQSWTRQVTLGIIDSLWILAHAFDAGRSQDPRDTMKDFFEAYVCGGIIKRPRPPLRTTEEDIFTGSFVLTYSYSPRKASEPRDYIFATMPQFPWYHYPEQAENMTFNEIFQDLYEQAMRSGHPFTCRITRSMVGHHNTPNDDWWKPSWWQPEPACLGDFLKLLGLRVNSVGLPLGRVSVPAVVHEFNMTEGTNAVIQLVKASMRFSQEIWVLGTHSFEISKYGGFPDDDTDFESNRQFFLKLAPYPGLAKRMMTFDFEEEEKRRATDDWQIRQSMKILTLLFSTVDKHQVHDVVMKADWESFKSHMKSEWPAQIRYLLLLLAAMVGCRIPLSAVKWARAHFVPVRIELGGVEVLGLLSKNASFNWQDESGREMLCLGRYLHPDRSGRDLTLADFQSEKPLGLVPDFTHYLQSEQEKWERLALLGQSFMGLEALQGRVNFISLE